MRVKQLRFIPTGPAESAGSALSEVVVRNAIVRACHCGSARTVGHPCAGCGTTAPPHIDDLGVVSTWYRNPIKRLLWKGVGARRAHRRTARMRRETAQTRRAPLVLLPPPDSSAPPTTE
jgi:hypothetical protein